MALAAAWCSSQVQPLVGTATPALVKISLLMKQAMVSKSFGTPYFLPSAV